MPKESLVFAIELRNAQFSIGQILAVNTKNVKCFTVGLFSQVFDSTEAFDPTDLSQRNCISILLSTTDLLDLPLISEVNQAKILLSKRFFPYRKELRKNGVGIKMFKPSILVDFMNAYHGLIPWDKYHDPLYFEKLLLDNSKKPKNLILEKK